MRIASISVIFARAREKTTTTYILGEFFRVFQRRRAHVIKCFGRIERAGRIGSVGWR